jgi:hypothetical protein
VALFGIETRKKPLEALAPWQDGSAVIVPVPGRAKVT